MRVGLSRRTERPGCTGPRVPCKGSLIQQVQVLPRQRSSRPGSYPSNRGGNEAIGAWETGGGARPSARWQAVTRVNTEAAPKDTMRRPTLPGLGEGWHGSNVSTGRQVRFASPGWWVTACHHGSTRNTGSPLGWPHRLGHQVHQAPGRKRVAEGLAVPMKPGNSGGGKEPWF